MSAEQAARSVADALAQASSPAASADVRRLVVTYSQQLKNSKDVAMSVNTAMLLVDPSAGMEAQHFGYGVLHHLVKVSWASLPQQDQERLYAMAWGYLQQSSNGSTSWAVRSKAALLVAEIARQAGLPVWEALLPALMQSAEEGPGKAASAAMVLQHVTEDVTIYADDLHAEKKRELLNMLNASMPQVLPFVVKLLEANFMEGSAKAQAGDREAAQQYSAVVQQALEAAGVCAGVMPIHLLHTHRVVDAAAFLLRTPEFNMQALDVLRKVAARKAAPDEIPALVAVCNALMSGAAPLLYDAAANAEMATGGANEELGQRICEVMAEFGTLHLEILMRYPESRMEFLRQMMLFAQHSDPILAGISLTMWNAVMSKVGAPKKVASPAAFVIPEEILRSLVEAVPSHMKPVVPLTLGEDNVPDMFLSKKEYKEFSSAYRSKLAKVVKDAAAQQPDAVLAVCVQQLAAAVASGSSVDLEVGTLMLEAGMSTFPAEWLQDPSKAETGRVVRALLDMPASAEPIHAGLHGRCLEATASYLKYHGELMQEVVSKLITMMTTIPFMGGDGSDAPPLLPPPGWKDAFAARVKIAGNVLGIAKTAGAQLAPHLQALSAHVIDLYQRHVIRIGEQNVLNEALLAASGEISVEVQAQLLEWLLVPVRESWSMQQQAVSSPAAFLREFAGMPRDSDTSAQELVGGRAPRWKVFHELQLLERALRRLPYAITPEQLQKMQEEGSQELPPVDPRHPILPHVGWAFTLPMRLLACISALWSPEGRAALGSAAPALAMSPAERQVYLGQMSGRVAREAGGQNNVEESVGGGSIQAMQMWLKGIRDSSYLLVSMAVDHIPGLYTNQQLMSEICSGMTAHCEHMDSRHLRLLLRHAVTALIRACPRGQGDAVRQTWLPPLLGPLLPMLRARLVNYWSAFSTSQARNEEETEDTTRAQDEVVEERVTRELSREVAILLQVLAGMQRYVVGHLNHLQPPRQMDAPASSAKGSQLEWMLQAMPSCAEEIVSIALASMTWPDSDAAHRGMSVCRALVGLADKCQSLQQVVVGDMLRAAITGLTLASNVVFQGELITLIREILVRGLASSPVTREVLLGLPGLDQALLQQFYSTFATESREKEQRLIIKRLLVDVGGEELKALDEWRVNHSGFGSFQGVALKDTSRRSQPADGFELSVDWSDAANPTINNT